MGSALGQGQDLVFVDCGHSLSQSSAATASDLDALMAQDCAPEMPPGSLELQDQGFVEVWEQDSVGGWDQDSVGGWDPGFDGE